MAMLSNEDFKKELGKNILIHPFNLEHLKGASLNLTASKLAWSLTTKQSIYKAETDEIVIPSNDTACIETEEAIWVSKKIAGTYHSKVTLVSSGLGHIGTTLDPDWIGPSLIAVHNHSKDSIRIRVGTSFVSICFYYLKNLTVRDKADSPGRIDVLNKLQFHITETESNWLKEEWRCAKDQLLDKMKGDSDYKRIINERASKTNWLKSGISKNIIFLLFCFAVAYITIMWIPKSNLTWSQAGFTIALVYLTVTGRQFLK